MELKCTDPNLWQIGIAARSDQLHGSDKIITTHIVPLHSMMSSSAVCMKTVPFRMVKQL